MADDADITASIESAGDIPAVGAACRSAAAAMGFPFFLYGFRMPLPLTQPCQFILSGYPAAWREHYDRERYLAIDPVLMRALSTVLPFAWDELERSDARVDQLFREAAGHGLRHGLSVPVHGAHGEGGLMSLAGKDPLPSKGPKRLALFQRAQWFTAVVHARMRSLVFREQPAPAAPLTARERECLQLAAQGMSAQGIGRDMNITERTVVFHLNRAEEKLGARRRLEAVARAVALGEIDRRCYPDRFSESKTLVELPDQG
jgi:DNA-binding CsgD family transcriptional regulator